MKKVIMVLLVFILLSYPTALADSELDDVSNYYYTLYGCSYVNFSKDTCTCLGMDWTKYLNTNIDYDVDTIREFCIFYYNGEFYKSSVEYDDHSTYVTEIIEDRFLPGDEVELTSLHTTYDTFGDLQLVTEASDVY